MAGPEHRVAVVVFGRPGSGKSSLSENLCTELGFDPIRTGDLVRAAIAEKNPVGLRVAELVKAGQLVEDTLIFELLQSQLKPPLARRLLFDGFPRTIGQVPLFQKLSDTGLFRIGGYIEIDVSATEAIRRMTGRRVCPTCRATYHVRQRPPRQEGLCDHDGTPLETRPDDTAEVVAARQKVYAESTDPVVEYYRTHQPHLFHCIEGERGFQVVEADLLDVVETILARTRLEER